MSVSEISQDRFTVPRVPPSEGTVGRFRRFVLLARNPLLAVPEAAYREPLVVDDRKSGVAYVCGPDLVNDVLLARAEAFPKDHIQKRVLGPLMGNGILISDGSDWRWQRRTVAGLFRHADILRYVPAMVAGAESALEAWRQAPSDTVHAIDRDMVRAAYRVIAGTILPVNDEAVSETIEESAAAFGRGLPWGIAVSALGLPQWVPYPGKRTMRAATRDLRNLVAGMIAERRTRPTGHDDLFTRLLGATDPQSGREMSDEQLVDNLLTFLLAGHDTTAKALTWALYLVSRLPEWEERLRAEVLAVAGHGPITGEQVARLALTQQFVKEVMRLYPPVPTMTRIAAGDTELGGEPIEAGTLIVIPIYVIHRHTALWEDPERFDPARFAADRERGYPRNQFMPFGGGRRVCVGAAFALVEATVVLATLIRAARFAYAGTEEPNAVAQVVLLPRDGMPMRVTPR